MKPVKMDDAELRLLFVSALLADGMGTLLKKGEIRVKDSRTWPLVVNLFLKDGSRAPDAVARSLDVGRIAVEYNERYRRRKKLKGALVGSDGWILSPECVRLNNGQRWDLESE